MALHLAAVLAFLLATLAVTSFAIPVQHSTWRHSCGQAVRAESKTHKAGGRHTVGNILKAVKKQLQIASEYFKSEDKNINASYYQVKSLPKEMFLYDWLPQNQVEWYNNKICSLRKNIKVKTGLQHLHRSLQNYAATFEEMKKFSPDSKAKIRSKIIGGVAEQLTQVLCEVEWALESLNATTPEKVAADLSKNWNNSPDNTRLLTQDWGVISLCQTFLGDWTLIVDRLNKKTVCKRPSWISRKKKANSKRTSRAPMSNGPRPLV